MKGVTHMFLRSGMTVKAVLQPESGDEIRVMNEVRCSTASRRRHTGVGDGIEF